MVENNELGTETIVWDLAPLYPALESSTIKQDIASCLSMATEIAGEYRGQVAQLDPASLNRLVERLEQLDTLLTRLSTYAFLAFITQTGEAQPSALLQKIEETEAQAGRLTVFFRLEWNQIDEATAQQFLREPVLGHYAHYLQTLRQYVPHQLSTQEEELLQELRPVGRSAWNLLFEKVLGQMRFGARQRTEDEVLADLYHQYRAVRRAGAEDLTAGLRDNLHVFAQIFNTLAAEKAIDDRLRRYPAWDSAINLANELQGTTVETLVAAVTSRYDLVQRYYSLKRELLQYQDLYDYDRYAPVPGAPAVHIPWDQAREMVLASFAAFSPEMAAIAGRFFQERWIHAPVMPGKRGGAFAHPCIPGIHPYILVNYTGTMRDVSDLAHELGHGVHQVLAAGQGLYNSDTPLVLAETASVFGEMLVFKAQLQHIEAPAARLAFLCQKLEGIIATVFRQVAMNRFEAGVHTARRAQGELSAGRLGELWLATQQAMFGDSVVLREDYSLWWAYISHFLATPGYVYAYAFGELLVLALYARYLDQGRPFIEQYMNLLRAGGSQSPYAALEPFAIDLDQPTFWHAGLSLIETMIDEAIAIHRESRPGRT